jgi:hypothetical protein
MISIAGFAVQEEVDHVTSASLRSVRCCAVACADALRRFSSRPAVWRGLVEEKVIPAAEANLFPF